jgi:hypothetical protein
MGEVGTEHPHSSAQKPGDGESGGSKSGNNRAGLGQSTPPAAPPPTSDPALMAVVAAWNHLPTAVRAGISAIVKGTQMITRGVVLFSPDDVPMVQAGGAASSSIRPRNLSSPSRIVSG